MLFRNWAKSFLFLLVYILSGLALLVIIDGLMTGSALEPFNIAVEQMVSHLRTPFLTTLMLAITNVGSPFILSILAILISIIIVINRDTYDTLLFMVSITFSIISFTVLKGMIHLPRPTGSLVNISSWSFPSGHSTVATAFFFSIAYTFFGKIKTSLGKVLLVSFSISAVILISISRIYLGAHYALDVLGGIALGLLSVSLTVLAFNIFLEEKRISRRKRLEKSI